MSDWVAKRSVFGSKNRAFLLRLTEDNAATKRLLLAPETVSFWSPVSSSMGCSEKDAWTAIARAQRPLVAIPVVAVARVKYNYEQERFSDFDEDQNETYESLRALSLPCRCKHCPLFLSGILFIVMSLPF